jgi:hypothetical protein
MGIEAIGRRRCCQALLAAAALAVVPAPAAAAGKRDLVVLDHERWIDTLKGTVKNFRKDTARDVTVVVKFVDKKKKDLGTQRVTVGDLTSGETRTWSLDIAEKHRKATRYDFTVHAIGK